MMAILLVRSLSIAVLAKGLVDFHLLASSRVRPQPLHHLSLLENWQKISKLDLKEIPVAYSQFFFNLKPGGSCFKLFPDWVLKKVISRIRKNGLIPVIYLHPYDILNESTFKLSFENHQFIA